jgi:hypothetical protein
MVNRKRTAERPSPSLPRKVGKIHLSCEKCTGSHSVDWSRGGKRCQVFPRCTPPRKFHLDSHRYFGLFSYHSDEPLSDASKWGVGDFPRGGTSSVGRASPCQGEGRGFETRVPLQKKSSLEFLRMIFVRASFPSLLVMPSRTQLRPAAIGCGCMCRILEKGTVNLTPLLVQPRDDLTIPDLARDHGNPHRSVRQQYGATGPLFVLEWNRKG